MCLVKYVLILKINNLRKYIFFRILKDFSSFRKLIISVIPAGHDVLTDVRKEKAIQ